MHPHRLIALLAGCLVALAAAVPAAAQTRGLRGGKIVVGESAGPVKLDMTRSEVVAALGEPYREEADAFMEYAPHPAYRMFDVYLDPTQDPARVRMFGIADGNWRIDGIHIFRRGNLRFFLRRYRKRVKRVTDRMTGDRLYRITSRFRGRRVWTDVYVKRFRPTADVIQVFILFA